jgi:translation initiation factor 2 subunit 1
VAPEDVAVCEERYNKSKLVHSIMRHVADTTATDLNVRLLRVARARPVALLLTSSLPNTQELYEHVGWPLYKRHKHAFEAFKLLGQEPGGSVLADLQRPAEAGSDQMVPAVTEAVREALLLNIRRRMTPQPLKIRADVELTCFGYDGVLHIKDAMRAAQALSRDDCIVKMKLVAPPLYVLTTQTLEKDVGIKLLEQATAAAAASIEAKKGRLVVKEGARAVSERDEKLLAEKLDKLAAANEEVDGDDDGEEEDDTMGSADIDAPPMPAEAAAAATPAAA